MHIHNVYFWLDDNQDEGSKAEFEEGLGWLVADPNVKSGYFGKPIASDRDVVEGSYTYGLVVFFEDTAGHDRYQVGEPHNRFLDKNMKKWTKVVVYDIQT